MKDNNIFIKNIKENLFMSHYHVNSIVNIITRLSESSITKETEQKLTPSIIFDSIEKSEKLNIDNPLDDVLFTLCSDLPFLSELFDEDYFESYVFDIKQVVNKDLKEENTLEFGNDIPNNPDDLLSLFKINIEKSNNPYVELINYKIMSYIFSKKYNETYVDIAFNSFYSIFQDDKHEQDINEEWFYKTPRTSDISHSGHVSMAYHSFINNSDIIGNMIRHFKSVINKK